MLRGKWCKTQFLGCPKAGKQRAPSSSVPQFPPCVPVGASLSGSRGEGGAVAPWVRSPQGPAPRGCPEKVRSSQCCVQPPRGLGDAGCPCSRPGPWAELPSGLPARLPRALQEAPGEPEHSPAAALHRGPSAVVRRDRALQGSSEPPGWRWEGQNQGQWELGWRVRA